ncbi:---NA---, partial [Paramuricea clavata]
SRETALHIAVKSKNLEMVKLLLDHGASCENIDRVRFKNCLVFREHLSEKDQSGHTLDR